MKILVLAPQPFFTPRGTPYSVYYRTLTMAEQGAEIDLLTYGVGRDVDIPGVRLLRIPHPRFLRNVGIGPSAAKLWLDVIMVFSFIRRLVAGRYDAVHAHEEAVFFAALLKPLFGYRLVYDMHSSLPQQLRNFEFTKSRVLVGLFRALERLSLERADVVVTVCPDLAEHAERRMSDPGRQLMIENTRFEPVRLVGNANRAARPGLRLPEGRRVVFYAGSFETYQGLDLLVRAFAQLAPNVSDLHLVLVGGREDQIRALGALARDLGVADRVDLPGPFPQVEVRRALEEADVLVSSRVTGSNTPLKIYEQLASGVPLVCTKIRAHTQVVDESLAFLVEPTVESIARGLETALGDPDEAARRAERAHTMARRKYSLEEFQRKTAELLERLR